MSIPLMRWLAGALLLVNLVYFWYASSLPEREAGVPLATAGVQQLVLLSELPAEVPAQQPAPPRDEDTADSRLDAPASENTPPSENAAPPVPLRCWELGPLDATTQAELAELFARVDMPMRSFERAEVNAANYRVYLAVNEPGQRADYQRQLQEYGMESYVIGGGELEGNLSLGLFSSRERAEAVAAPLQELDLPVVIRTRERRQNRNWLRLDSGEVEALGWSADLAELTLRPQPGIQAVDCDEENNRESQ